MVPFKEKVLKQTQKLDIEILNPGLIPDFINQKHMRGTKFSLSFMLHEFITGLSWLVARVGSEEFITLLHIKFGPRPTQAKTIQISVLALGY